MWKQRIKEKASVVWENDLKKKKHAEKFGYSVFYVWEDEDPTPILRTILEGTNNE